MSISLQRIARCVRELKNSNIYRGADKSLARPERKQAWKHFRDARDFNNIETRAVIKFLFLQGKAPKEINAILTQTLAFFLPGRAKDLLAPTVYMFQSNTTIVKTQQYFVIQLLPKSCTLKIVSCLNGNVNIHCCF